MAKLKWYLLLLLLLLMDPVNEIMDHTPVMPRSQKWMNEYSYDT